MAKPKHRITLEQYVKIIEWLKENKHRILREELTQLPTAQEATLALGFAVPITSIQKCGKIAKIKWAKSPTPPPPVPLEREAIIILIGSIAGLYVETGKTVPTELANLQTVYVREQVEEVEEDEDIKNHPNKYHNESN